MYRIEFYSLKHGLQTETYVSQQLAEARWLAVHKPTTMHARFYAPNGERIDQFSNWEAANQKVAA